jgi:uncharacterized protein YsxB (DUF464 family)
LLSERKKIMIDIRIETDNAGCVTNLRVDGHAEFSDQEHGGDIVCSAVSALVGFLGITFTEVLPGKAVLEAADGAFCLTLGEGSALLPEVRTVLAGWRLSVLSLEENYSGWVKVEEHIKGDSEE